MGGFFKKKTDSVVKDAVKTLKEEAKKVSPNLVANILLPLFLIALIFAESKGGDSEGSRQSINNIYITYGGPKV